MKKKVKNKRREFLRKSIIASAGFVIGAKAVKLLADYEHQKGRLIIENYIYSADFGRGRYNLIHRPEGTEEYDVYDILYGGLPPSGKLPKIISIVKSQELELDTRPIDSLTPVNIELSLHNVPNGEDIIVNNMRNELQCKFMEGYTFGKKPICIYRVHDESLEFLADLREAIAKDVDGIARIPLPDLCGTYQSEVPYDKLQLRFEFPGDFNMDGRVDMKDAKTLSEDWLADPNEKSVIADITGPNGVPDNKINALDYNHLAKDYRKDANDPNTW